MSLWNRIKEIAAVANVRKPVPNAVPAREVSPPAKPIQAPILPNGNPIPVAAAVTLPPVTHPGPMRTSSKGLALIKSFESCAKAIGSGRFEAYPDPAPGNNGLPVTIGWGSTRDFQGNPIKLGTVWTQEQCDRKKAEDMAKFEREVRDILGNAPTTQGQFDALVSFAYNLGSGNLRKSTLMKLHKAGNYAAAAKQFGVWNRAGGKVMRGLSRRRVAEATLYRSAS